MYNAYGFASNTMFYVDYKCNESFIFLLIQNSGVLYHSNFIPFSFIMFYKFGNVFITLLTLLSTDFHNIIAQNRYSIEKLLFIVLLIDCPIVRCYLIVLN